MRCPTAKDRDATFERERQELGSMGCDLLQEVHDFLGRFVIYPSEATHVAHTLWIAHTYFMDHWDSTPRIAFLSPEPGSGKSRAGCALPCWL
jgi:hypothetical protein